MCIRDRNKARVAAKQKEYSASPHGKARRKEYNAKRYITPQGKAKQKEYQRRYMASPHGKAKRKEWNAKRQATPHRMATLHGKETTSGRLRVEGGEPPHCQKRKR